MNLTATFSRERAVMNSTLLRDLACFGGAIIVLILCISMIIGVGYFIFGMYKVNIKNQEFEKKFKQHTGKKITFGHYEESFVHNVIFPQDIGSGWESICVPKEIVAQLQRQVISPLNAIKLAQKNLPWQALPPKGILFSGAPGTGKSLLARTLGKETNCAFINIRSTQMLSMYAGESEKIIKGLFTLAKKLEPCMLFLDEIDSLFSNNSLTATFLTYWDGVTAEKEQSPGSGSVIIVGATSKHRNIDQSLLRRFDLNIEIPLPTLVDRMLILEIQLKGINREGVFNLRKLATMTNGFSGADLKEVVRHAAISCIDELREKAIKADQERLKLGQAGSRMENNVEKKMSTIRETTSRACSVSNMHSVHKSLSNLASKVADDSLFRETISNDTRSLKIDSEDEDPLKLDQRLKCEVVITMAQMVKSIEESKKSRSKNGGGYGGLDEYEVVLAGNLVHPRDLDVTWKDIAGLNDVIKEIKKHVIIPIAAAINRQKINSQLVSCPKGVLFSGPPGSGKTLLAKALCYHSRCTFINLDVSCLQTKYYGESQKLTSALFRLADKYQPSIIFIDEIDGFLRQRQSQDHETTATIKSQFLSLWDGILTDPNKITIIVGASNRPEDIDPAVMRRLSKKFKITLPNLENREKILKMILDKENNIAPNVNLKTLAGLTEGFSPAELKDMACTAAVNSLHAKTNLKEDALNNNDDSLISLELYALDSCRSLAGSWSIMDGNFGGVLTVKEITMERFLTAIETIRKAKADTTPVDNSSIYS